MCADELLGNAPVGGGHLECGGLAVGEDVVGNQPLEADDEGGVERGRALEESSSGGALLVGTDLHVDKPGVVVDSEVEEVVADATSAGLLAATVGAPPAAVRDPAQFLDVDIHQ